MIAAGDAVRAEHFGEYALNIGMAFQIRDDILGIWGDEAITGKSASSDIVAHKKSLPVLHGLPLNDEPARAVRSSSVVPVRCRPCCAAPSARWARKNMRFRSNGNTPRRRCTRWIRPRRPRKAARSCSLSLPPCLLEAARSNRAARRCSRSARARSG
ncbi:MAG: hypothetical protein HND48_10590 [Chloroflexi bacterium]|nr:hypothetical protein [Chloroflexota bacterium]